MIIESGHAHEDYEEGFAVAVQVVAAIAIASTKHRSFVVVHAVRLPWRRGQLQQLVRDGIPDSDVELHIHCVKGYGRDGS